MTSLPNTCRRFPAGIHKLDYNSSIYIDVFELLRVIMEYLSSFFSITVAIKLFIILFSLFLHKFRFSTRIYFKIKKRILMRCY